MDCHLHAPESSSRRVIFCRPDAPRFQAVSHGPASIACRCSIRHGKCQLGSEARNGGHQDGSSRGGGYKRAVCNPRGHPRRKQEQAQPKQHGRFFPFNALYHRGAAPLRSQPRSSPAQADRCAKLMRPSAAGEKEQRLRTLPETATLSKSQSWKRASNQIALEAKAICMKRCCHFQPAIRKPDRGVATRRPRLPLLEHVPFWEQPGGL